MTSQFTRFRELHEKSLNKIRQNLKTLPNRVEIYIDDDEKMGLYDIIDSIRDVDSSRCSEEFKQLKEQAIKALQEFNNAYAAEEARLNAENEPFCEKIRELESEFNRQLRGEEARLDRQTLINHSKMGMGEEGLNRLDDIYADLGLTHWRRDPYGDTVFSDSTSIKKLKAKIQKRLSAWVDVAILEANIMTSDNRASLKTLCQHKKR